MAALRIVDGQLAESARLSAQKTKPPRLKIISIEFVDTPLTPTKSTASAHLRINSHHNVALARRKSRRHAASLQTNSTATRKAACPRSTLPQVQPHFARGYPSLREFRSRVPVRFCRRALAQRR